MDELHKRRRIAPSPPAQTPMETDHALPKAVLADVVPQVSSYLGPRERAALRCSERRIRDAVDAENRTRAKWSENVVGRTTRRQGLVGGHQFDYLSSAADCILQSRTVLNTAFELPTQTVDLRKPKARVVLCESEAVALILTAPNAVTVSRGRIRLEAAEAEYLREAGIDSLWATQTLPREFVRRVLSPDVDPAEETQVDFVLEKKKQLWLHALAAGLKPERLNAPPLWLKLLTVSLLTHYDKSLGKCCELASFLESWLNADEKKIVIDHPESLRMLGPRAAALTLVLLGGPERPAWIEAELRKDRDQPASALLSCFGERWGPGDSVGLGMMYRDAMDSRPEALAKLDSQMKDHADASNGRILPPEEVKQAQLAPPQAVPQVVATTMQMFSDRGIQPEVVGLFPFALAHQGAGGKKGLHWLLEQALKLHPRHEDLDLRALAPQLCAAAADYAEKQARNAELLVRLAANPRTRKAAFKLPWESEADGGMPRGHRILRGGAELFRNDPVEALRMFNQEIEAEWQKAQGDPSASFTKSGFDSDAAGELTLESKLAIVCWFVSRFKRTPLLMVLSWLRAKYKDLDPENFERCLGKVELPRPRPPVSDLKRLSLLPEDLPRLLLAKVVAQGRHLEDLTEAQAQALARAEEQALQHVGAVGELLMVFARSTGRALQPGCLEFLRALVKQDPNVSVWKAMASIQGRAPRWGAADLMLNRPMLRELKRPGETEAVSLGRILRESLLPRITSDLTANRGRDFWCRGYIVDKKPRKLPEPPDNVAQVIGAIIGLSLERHAAVPEIVVSADVRAEVLGALDADYNGLHRTHNEKQRVARVRRALVAKLMVPAAPPADAAPAMAS